jgi:hypothetical protein
MTCTQCYGDGDFCPYCSETGEVCPECEQSYEDCDCGFGDEDEGYCDDWDLDDEQPEDNI